MVPVTALIVVVVLLLTGCATPLQTPALRGDPPDHLPRQVELKDTPFHPQDRYQCGPAALATALNAQGISITPQALVPEVYLPARQGSLQAEMLAATRARALVAWPVPPRMEALLQELAAGHPVVVLQNLGLNWAPHWHYAVVIGYDLDAGIVILRSGTIERHVNSLQRFERTWRRAGYWGFLTQPPDRLPATATPLSWLRAANDLERTGQQDAAVHAYLTATQTWPEHPVGWIGLGNAHYARGDLTGAEQAFRALIRQDPTAHAGWNNLAHVLHAQGCRARAQAAATCALQLAPDDPLYRRTWDTVTAPSPSADLCPQERAAGDHADVICPLAP
ncbi:Tetratricopeptide repeat-containing protein [Ectothiorhodospira magna]|uniref:Tetratricopeptide repeat-containing protein n=1 Tax=Ectothiorhodospira magna TaxID=867345 RepID=A0A1H9ECY6_9GAMM|nr:PA2778 family cysteine peptidase [Ectothiorhodospira magna]SEQ23626.1 Tetratricopeptide repeat-containing protein [Ectothiorhodospira magna]